MRTHELIIYKNLEQEQILNDMTFLMENYNNEYYNEEDLKSLLFACTGKRGGPEKPSLCVHRQHTGALCGPRL